MRQLEVNCNGNSYPIYIGSNLINNLDKYINVETKTFIICDENVPSLLVDIICNQIDNHYLMIIKSGENSKSIATYESIMNKCVEFNLTRKDQIITLGGGVIGDVGGYVASTYMRGVTWINIPTTSLSQVDSSIGGKVGINFDSIKNIIGAFYEPSCVIIDHEFLKSLPIRHLKSGLMEALKMGILYNSDILNAFEAGYLHHLDEIIYQSLLAKKEIVEQDFKEDNIRKQLNFGHTFGHAFEAYFDFDTFLHGECVANGMLMMIDDEALIDRVTKILKDLDIPFIDNFDDDKIFELIQLDKKSYSNKISLVKIKTINEPYIEECLIDDIKNILKEDLHGKYSW